MNPGFGLDAAKDIGRTATLVIIIPSCDLPELHWNWRPRVLMQDHRLFVHANHRFVFRQRLFVCLEHVLHLVDVLLVQLPHAPHLMGWSAAFIQPASEVETAHGGAIPWNYTRSALISARRSFIWLVLTGAAKSSCARSSRANNYCTSP